MGAGQCGFAGAGHASASNPTSLTCGAFGLTTPAIALASSSSTCPLSTTRLVHRMPFDATVTSIIPVGMKSWRSLNF